MNDWLVALRPKTLPASIAPVLVGLALAIHNNFFQTSTAFSALFVAILLQVSVNFANDYFDYKSGVDKPDSPGFERACASGKLNPSSVKRAMFLTLLLAVVPGIHLVYYGGVPLLIAGILSLLATVGYSGGPIPYGSYALGDLMVFLFFGIIATTGTYYVQFCASTGLILPWTPPVQFLTLESFLIALPPGALSTAILVVNNLRDIENDQNSGKYTMAVLLGPRGSMIEYASLLGLAYAVPIYFYLDNFRALILLPLLSLPMAGSILQTISQPQIPDQLNRCLSRTAQLLLLHSVLFGLGIVLS